MLTEPFALVISVAIESPVAYAAAKLARWPCRGPLHVAVASAVATAVTHPQLWSAVIWASPRFGYWPSLSLAELTVVATEGLLIAWMAALKLQRAMLVSLVANAASFAAGLVLFVS